eukprot:1143671-Pelagomonas_calceolata.AAC.1
MQRAFVLNKGHDCQWTPPIKMDNALHGWKQAFPFKSHISCRASPPLLQKSCVGPINLIHIQ